MNYLYDNAKAAQRAGDFPAFFEKNRDAWNAAIADVSPKTISKIERWAARYDLVSVIESIAERVDAEQLRAELFCRCAWNSIQWAVAQEIIHTPFKSDNHSMVLAFKMAQGGYLERLEWLAERVDPKVFRDSCSLDYAAKSKKLEVVAWFLEKGAASRNFLEFLRNGLVSVFKTELLPTPAAEILGGRLSALNAAIFSGDIPTIEWVVLTFFPAGDYLLGSVVAQAMKHRHIHVLRWLHEGAGVPLEEIRVAYGPPHKYFKYTHGYSKLTLENLTDLQDLLAFSREEVTVSVLENCQFVESPEIMDWFQSTFQFTTEEIVAQNFLMSWGLHRATSSVEWLVRTFEFRPEDWQTHNVLRSLLCFGCLPALKRLHRMHPITPGTLLRVYPNILAALVDRGRVEELKWLHAVVGVRANDPKLVANALSHWNREKSHALLYALADTYGISRTPVEISAFNILRSEKTLQIMHDKFGFGVENLWALNWDNFNCANPGLIRVCVDTFGMSYRDIRKRVARKGNLCTQEVIAMQSELGMTADDWRSDDYAALRPRAAGVCGYIYHRLVELLVQLYGFNADDMTALLASPGITPSSAQIFRFFAAEMQAPVV